MLRTGLSVTLLLCCLSVPARADDPPAPRSEAKPAPRPTVPRKTARPRAKKADAAASKPLADSLIVPSSAAREAGDIAPRAPVAGQEAWSVSPKWSASNGGSSAPYGTRALLNELQANPAETTGYGAGAEVNFHF